MMLRLARTEALKNKTPLGENAAPCSSGAITISTQTASSKSLLIKRMPAVRHTQQQ